MLQNIDLLGLPRRKPARSGSGSGQASKSPAAAAPAGPSTKALIKCRSQQPPPAAQAALQLPPSRLYLSCIVFLAVVWLAGEGSRANNGPDCRHHNHQSLGAPASAPDASQISAPAGQCSDCLAIPLVAIMGNKQVSGFIVSARRKQIDSAGSGPEVPGAYPGGGSQTSPAKSEPAAYNKRYAYAPEAAPPRPFAPHSNDRKCPMHGPVTVCEQVEAYPAEAILHKLERARRVLKASYFNIDSLFSDERDHSNEPFEGPSEAGRNLSLASTSGESGAGGRATKSTSQQSAPHYRQAGVKSAALEQQNDYEPRFSSEALGYNDNNNNNKDESRPLRSASVADVNDEFVDLVERQAIRLSGRQYLGPQANISPVSGLSRHRQRRNPEPGRDNNGLASERVQVKLTEEVPRIPEAEMLDASYARHTSERRRRLRRQRRANANWRPKRQANPATGAEPEGSAAPEEAGLMSFAGEEANQIEPACRARSIYISPRAALNDKKQWKYVVNAPERNPQVRQIIRVDVCEDPSGPCSSQISIPFGFSSQCKQKYSKKKLLALDDQSGLLEVDTFFIPTCCVCQLVRDKLPSDADGGQPATANGADNGSGESDAPEAGGSFGSASSPSSASLAKTSPPVASSRANRAPRQQAPTTTTIDGNLGDFRRAGALNS